MGRPLQDVNDDTKNYNTELNPGLYQDTVLLPPYLLPGSPEALAYVDEFPQGWSPEYTDLFTAELVDDNEEEEDEEEVDEHEDEDNTAKDAMSSEL